MGDQPTIIERQFHIDVAGDGLFVKLLLHATPEVEETRPTWVFLHEALGSVGQWKSFPFELCRATGYDAIVYDRVGHGRSTPMRKGRDLDFYEEEAAVYLRGLLAEMNVRKPLLFGHSDGATLALKYAALFPDALVGAVVEAPHVVIEDVTVSGIQEAKILYEESDLREKLMRYHGERTDAVFGAWIDTWLDPAGAEWNMLADLAAIRCPLLLIQGDADQYGTRRQVELIAERVQGPAALLWLEGIGHVPHLQARTRVVDETARWVPGQNPVARR
ncbi:MAG: alpha/beta hydrolase [Bacteroidota bacterium]|jgi:pimeloyl-ACP methyl ester carboxylesterase|nr:alpha/beta hydrolase [Bacteroidota bacterium]